MKDRSVDTNYYVYSHLDLDGKCFYIGKGSKDRVKDGAKSRSDEWHAKTKDGFMWKILVSNLTNTQAYELERSFCEQIGWDNLVNKHPTLNKEGNQYTRNGKSEVQLLAEENGWTYGKAWNFLKRQNEN